ncbi:MAG: polysaccharide deacetylase family protein [Kiritimatiellaeota bacterium]|nr:polysaccharide deacetylase family protein [Kiritimatiellota bacterium]
MILGLKIDVDTYRGTREGVLPLVRALDEAGVRGSFFFSVGPDNMGRHLWRLIKPQFFMKMLRSGGASLYGWDILLRGTFWPGALIGKAFAGVIKQVAAAGHETGLHAWDHHAWQMRMERGGAAFQAAHLKLGGDTLAQILGRWPDCSAAPGWKCNDATLLAKAKLPFRYNSDVRGMSIFRPFVGEQPLVQPQIPTTLPTYDEVIGRNGLTNAGYNAWLLDQFKPDALNVLTVHAEVEGIVCHEMFRDFLRLVWQRGWQIKPLGELLPPQPEVLPLARVVPFTQPGREGWIAAQQ